VAADRAGAGTESEPEAQGPPVRETLDARLVSRAEYEDCVRRTWCTALSQSGPCKRAVLLNRGDRPVICASWDQAVAFCLWDDGRRADGRLPRREDWLDAGRSDRSFETTDLKEWIAGRTYDDPAFRTRSAIAHGSGGSVNALPIHRGEGRPDIGFRCVRPESAPPG
jgi:hypothetical protein